MPSWGELTVQRNCSSMLCLPSTAVQLRFVFHNVPSFDQCALNRNYFALSRIVNRNNRKSHDDDAETSGRKLRKFRPMFAGVNVSFHLYCKPLGGKIFQRYPKQEKRRENKVGLYLRDWPRFLEVTMSLDKGHHMTKRSSELN